MSDKGSQNYLVLARKWRPLSFQEMIGQDHISQTLNNALRSQRLHHALLFTGPRGVGKTSSARILAKSLKCQNTTDYTPCNQCRDCKEIMMSSHVDVMEIDGASHNGVDAIRDLRDTVSYMPSHGKYKIYIIDEVHMLSTSAFNALLKTLEEPPAHVIFIFATTEPHKIPLTILSRVQRFDLRRIPVRLLVERLEQICKSENVSFEAEALWLIGRHSEGSARDSQSLLDQIITFSDGFVTTVKTIEMLGLTNRALILDGLRAVIRHDATLALNVITNIYDSGVDPKIFVQDFLEALRNTLILKINRDQKTLIDLPDSEMEELKSLGSHLGDEDLHFIFDMGLKGFSDLARAPDSRLALEMLLLRMTQAPRIRNIGEWLQQMPTKVSTDLPTTPPAHPDEDKPLNSSAPQLLSKEPTERWNQTVQILKERNASLAAKLSHASLASTDHPELIFSQDKKFLYDQLNDSRSIQEISLLISDIWKENIQITLTLGPSANVTPIQRQELKQKEEQKTIRQEIEGHALIQNIKNHFDIQIKSIVSKTTSEEKT